MLISRPNLPFVLPLLSFCFIFMAKLECNFFLLFWHFTDTVFENLQATSEGKRSEWRENMEMQYRLGRRDYEKRGISSYELCIFYVQ